jgi:hypothetical protein
MLQKALRFTCLQRHIKQDSLLARTATTGQDEPRPDQEFGVETAVRT